MGLKILITEEQIEIPELGIKTHFTPPSDAQSNVAHQTLSLLKDSPYLQIKSKADDRKEILQILKDYGKLLFDSILPPRLNIAFDSFQGLDLHIGFLLWQQITWELLHDGKDWLARQGGVKRIHSGIAKMRYPVVQQIANWQFFTSHPSLEKKYHLPSFEFYHSPHDWFIENNSNLYENIQWNILFNRTVENFYSILKTNPRYLFLQGFLDVAQFFFFSENKEIKKNITYFPFTKAIEKGLELLVLNCKQLKDFKDSNHSVLLEKLFQLGMPTLINFSGSIHRKNIRTYMTCLILQIVQRKNFFTAHLQALKQMSQTLSYSWDWIWVQFWENNKLIAPQKKNTVIDYSQNARNNKKYFSRQKFWYLRKFYGSTQILQELKEKIVNLTSSRRATLTENILWIQDEKLQTAVNYLHHFAMECYQDYQYIQINYKRENLNLSSDNEPNHEITTPLQKHIQQAKNLLFPKETDLSTWDTIYNLEEKRDPQKNNLLFVFLLSEDFSSSFMEWLTKKKEWKIIIVVHEKKEFIAKETDRKFYLRSLNWNEILNFFDYPTRKSIQESLSFKLQNNSTALSYRLIKLLYLAKHLNFKPINFNQEECIWKQIIDDLPQRLSPLSLRILSICYLFASFIPIEFLAEFLGIKNLDAHLEKLYHYHFIEKNLDQKQITLESGFYFLLTKYSFFEQKKLQQARIFLLKFFSEKSIFKKHQTTLSLYIFSNLDSLLEIEDKNITYRDLKNIFSFLKWDLKKILYLRIFEKAAFFSEKRTLIWLCKFYQENLFNRIFFYQVNSKFVEKLQEINELLETKEEWELLFQNHLALANYFLIKENYQKTRNFLAPVIELLKEKTGSFQNISDVAFLLIALDDISTLTSLLEHFSFYKATQNYKKYELERNYIKAYQAYKKGDEKTVLDLLLNKIGAAVNVARYYKIYAIYIVLCSKFQLTSDLKFFLENIYFEETFPYYPYQVLISTLFNSLGQNKDLLKQQKKIDDKFIDLLEKYYRVAQKNKDKKIFTYADLLGKLYYEAGNEQKYKFYLEEYYEETNTMPEDTMPE